MCIQTVFLHLSPYSDPIVTLHMRLFYKKSEIYKIYKTVRQMPFIPS